MVETPQIVQTSTQIAAVIRLTIPKEEIQAVMGPAIAELKAAIAAQGVVSSGPIFAHHLKTDPDIFDFEIGIPVTTLISAAGRVQAGTLPAATVARTVYHGPYEGLGSAWCEFGSWIAAQGHAPAPDFWECYLSGPEASTDPSAWGTELNRPLQAQEGQAASEKRTAR